MWERTWVRDARPDDARWRPFVPLAGTLGPVPSTAVSEFVIISGLSGAGRSEAANNLEDLGWFVVDNLPPSLIPKIAELAQAPGSTTDRVVLVVGSGPYRSELLDGLDELATPGGRCPGLCSSTLRPMSSSGATRRRVVAIPIAMATR